MVKETLNTANEESETMDKHWAWFPFPGAGHLFRYVTNQPPNANSGFIPPESVNEYQLRLGRQRQAVHSVSGWTRGVQAKLWDPLRTRAILERLRGVFTTRRYTNPRLPYPTLPSSALNKNNDYGNCEVNTNISNVVILATVHLKSVDCTRVVRCKELRVISQTRRAVINNGCAPWCIHKT